MDRFSTIVSELKAAIAALERDLEMDPRRQQLERLRGALAELEPNSDAASGEETSEDEQPEDPTNREIREYLGRHPGGAAKRAILKYLLGNGHLRNAQDPGKALGKRLSRMDDIEGDGKGNYALKRMPRPKPGEFDIPPRAA
jgi:hypothetical protein